MLIQKPTRPVGTPPMEGNCHRTIATATNIAFEGSFTRHCRPAIATLHPASEMMEGENV